MCINKNEILHIIQLFIVTLLELEHLKDIRKQTA